MHLLQVFSRLLDYPDTALLDQREELLAAITASDLTDAHKASSPPSCRTVWPAT